MSTTSTPTRQPAVAGMLYPSDAITLKHEISVYLEQAESQRSESLSSLVPKAIVVPHAGYIYSGPVAASAYQYLLPLRKHIKRVVLIGPSHRVAFHGLALPDCVQFSTPLGNIPVDYQSIRNLIELPQVIVSEMAHRDEHSLEVQLPFLQSILDDFSLIPILVGDASADEVAEVINRLWGNEQTLIIISTDLSHYHNYDEARAMDRSTSDAIASLQLEQIHYDSACGRNGLLGMMQVARERQMDVDVLDLRNSGDTAGSRDRVVGYGAYAFH